MGKPIIEYRKSDLYDKFVDQHGVFEHSYDFMVFLAVLGYHENMPKRDNFRGDREGGTRGEIGIQNVYSNELYRAIMTCLAFQDTGDPEALVDQRKQMDVLAQYAAGGLELAEQEFGDVAGDPTDALINYIKRQEGETTGMSGELAEIVKSFDNQMTQLE